MWLGMDDFQKKPRRYLTTAQYKARVATVLTSYSVPKPGQEYSFLSKLVRGRPNDWPGVARTSSGAQASNPTLACEIDLSFATLRSASAELCSACALSFFAIHCKNSMTLRVCMCSALHTRRVPKGQRSDYKSRLRAYAAPCACALWAR